MSSEEFSIRVQNVGKCFYIYPPRGRRKQLIVPYIDKLLGKKPRCYYEDFWVLRNVSFTIKPGQCVGIIGHNGCGKSTLLQMITGILHPTEGKIQVNGRISALIELGSGFNPEFTGRENVYLNGSLLGLSKAEIDRKFDQIAGFAEIGVHIDRPVRTYSSGMMMRLAFAVPMAIEPEILIIDEALAVGDVKFQQKCFNRLNELKKMGTTILFVSHSLDIVRSFCDIGILIHQGQIEFIGDPTLATEKHLTLLYQESTCNTA